MLFGNPTSRGASELVRGSMMLEEKASISVLGSDERSLCNHFSHCFRRSGISLELIMIIRIEVGVVGFVEDYGIEDRTSGYDSQLHSEILWCIRAPSHSWIRNEGDFIWCFHNRRRIPLKEFDQ